MFEITCKNCGKIITKFCITDIFILRCDCKYFLIKDFTPTGNASIIEKKCFQNNKSKTMTAIWANRNFGNQSNATNETTKTKQQNHK